MLTKCLPILFYGLDSLPINCNVLQFLTKFWNMAFKWIYGLRKYDSTRLLFQSCNTMSAKFLLHRCWLLFYNSISVSSCPVVHSLWRWFSTQSCFRKLLSLYKIDSVECRRSIYDAVSLRFQEYCDDDN
jgi:hypothetical protein